METFTASAYRSKTSRRKTQRRVRKGDVNVHASSIAEMMDKVMQNTVGEYLKTLIEGEWKPIFEAFYTAQNGDQDSDDSDHSDDDEDAREETVDDKTAKHVIGGLKVWNEMTHQSRGLSFISYPFGYYSCASATPVAEVGEESKVGEKKKNDNAYLRFCRVTRVQIKTENPSLKFGEITTETAQRWRNLSPEEKAAFAPPPPSEPEAPESPVAVVNNEAEAISGEVSGHQNDQVTEEEEETVPQEMATQLDKYPPTQDSECNGFDYSPKSVDEDSQEDEKDNKEDVKGDVEEEEEEEDEDEKLEGQKIQVTITRDFVDKKKRLELTGSQRNMLANLQKNSKSEILQMVEEANLDVSGMGPPSKIGKSELINLFMNFSFSS